MKNILLIDGENFVHALVHSLKKNGLLKTRSQLHKIDINSLLTAVNKEKFTEVRYYTTKIQVRSAPKDLQTSVGRIRAWNAKWTPFLANQGVKFIKAGNLRVRDAKQCIKCGHKGYVLQEKGVDVRLAVDIVTTAAKDTTLYVLSSDSDLLASFDVVKEKGAKAIYVMFEGMKNHALARRADRVVVIKDEVIIKAYKETNKHG